MEQYLCHSKALLFHDIHAADEIISLTDPKLQKHRAKRLKNYNIETWTKNASTILLKGLKGKFSQNIDLLNSLRQTGSTILGEAAANDTLFGIGLSLFNPLVMDPAKWRGSNLLGIALMQIRDANK